MAAEASPPNESRRVVPPRLTTATATEHAFHYGTHSAATEHQSSTATEHALDFVACIAVLSRDLMATSMRFAAKMCIQTSSPRQSPEAVLEDLLFVLQAVLEDHT